MSRSYQLARIALILAILTPVYFAIAALGTKFGLWSWQFGLGTLTAQGGPILLGIVALLAVIALVWCLAKPPRKGLALALAWPIGLVFAVVWLGAVLLLRISSLGGMLGAVSAPIAALAFGYPVYAIGLAGLAVIVLWRHRENIARLRAGTEPRVGAGKEPK